MYDPILNTSFATQTYHIVILLLHTQSVALLVGEASKCLCQHTDDISKTTAKKKMSQQFFFAVQGTFVH